MLQKQAVSPELLELLTTIMKSNVFSDFILAGETSLALQIGHRYSVDLDFFGKNGINEDLFLEELSHFGQVMKIGSSKNILVCTINGIKVDFVNYQYDFIDKPIEMENLRLATMRDIAGMKLNAIEGRGTKKDFIDLYFLLKYFSLSEMIDFYRNKYPNHSDFMMLKSLTYFEDAEQFPMPIMFKEFDWEKCKNLIKKEFNKIGL